MRINENYLLREVGGEYLFIPIGGSGTADAILVTNRVGAAIWQFYCENPDPEAVAAGMKERFDCDEAELRKDLTAFTALLLEKKLLLRE